MHLQEFATSHPVLCSQFLKHLLDVAEISVAECLGKLSLTCRSLYLVVRDSELLHLPYCKAITVRRCYMNHFCERRIAERSLGHYVCRRQDTPHPHYYEPSHPFVGGGSYASTYVEISGHFLSCISGCQPTNRKRRLEGEGPALAFERYDSKEECVRQLKRDRIEGLYWLRQKPRMIRERGPHLILVVPFGHGMRNDLDDKSICRMCWEGKKVKVTRNSARDSGVRLHYCAKCDPFKQFWANPDSRALLPPVPLAKRRRANATAPLPVPDDDY